VNIEAEISERVNIGVHFYNVTGFLLGDLLIGGETYVARYNYRFNEVTSTKNYKHIEESVYEFFDYLGLNIIATDVSTFEHKRDYLPDDITTFEYMLKIGEIAHVDVYVTDEISRLTKEDFSTIENYWKMHEIYLVGSVNIIQVDKNYTVTQADKERLRSYGASVTDSFPSNIYMTLVERDDKKYLYFRYSSTNGTILSMGPYNQLTLAAENGGRVNSEKTDIYIKGDRVLIEAFPDDGYEFSNWISSAGGKFGNLSNDITVFTMPANEVTVTAIFKKEDTGELE
jgi:hypothetical protein